MHRKNPLSNYATRIGFLVAALSIAGCQQDNEVSPVPVSDTGSKHESYNEVSSNVAKLLAASLESSDIRRFLKDEAVKQFDGDYDILLQEARHKQVNNSSFESMLEKGMSRMSISSASTCKNFFDILRKEHPLLQISIPELESASPETWNIETHQPLVAFLPEDYQEGQTKTITAFDAQGNTYTLDAEKDPEQVVIVVSKSERLFVEAAGHTGARKEKPYFSTDTHNYYFKNLAPEPVKTERNNSPAGRTKAFDRDNDTGRDILWKGRFVSKTAYRQVEGWPAGRPEFRVIIGYIDRSSGTGVAASTEKYVDEKGWVKRYVVTATLQTKTINIPIFRWYKDRYGSDMKYQWIETDGGGDSKVETELGISTKYDDNTTVTGKVKVTYDNNDEPAGDAIVQYEDTTTGDGTEYNTGIIRFWIKQE